MIRALPSVALVALALCASTPARAVAVAPRISDREIVDRLARVETNLSGVQVGLANLEREVQEFRAEAYRRFTQVDDRFNQVDGRLAQIDARFAQIDARFAQIDARFAQVDARFEQVDDRFDRLEAHMNRQFDRLHDLMLGLLAAFTAMTVSTVGFALWDRRSMLRPLEAAVVDLRASTASDRARTDAIVEALRSLGRSDHRLVEILRRLRLL